MIKRLLTDAEYTITSTTTIVIASSISFEHKNLALITQTLSNDIVFNFACEDLRATLSGNTITLVNGVVILGEELSIILSFEEGETEQEKLLRLILNQTEVNQSIIEELKLQTELLRTLN